MNRYHFNFRSGDEIFPDKRGIYLPDDEEAFDEAIRTWHDLIAAGDVSEKRDSAIEISDADGTVIITISRGYAQRSKDG